MLCSIENISQHLGIFLFIIYSDPHPMRERESNVGSSPSSQPERSVLTRFSP